MRTIIQRRLVNMSVASLMRQLWRSVAAMNKYDNLRGAHADAAYHDALDRINHIEVALGKSKEGRRALKALHRKYPV